MPGAPVPALLGPGARRRRRRRRRATTGPTPQRAESEAAAGGGGKAAPRAPVRALTTRNGQLINVATGKPIFLAGVNWFGFDVPGGTTMVDGLWAGGSGLTADLSTVAYRLRLLGFNAVRLPFSMKELFEATPRPVGRAGGSPLPRSAVDRRLGARPRRRFASRALPLRGR